MKWQALTKQEIEAKYLKPPPIDMVVSFIKEVGAKFSHFERYYGMHEGLIRNVKCGNKPVPVKYWPIFYERIVPTYGVGFQRVEPKRTVSKIVSKQSDNHAHTRLPEVK